MNVLEWVLNFILNITSLWDNCHDDIINEHRAYERRIIVYTVFTFILMSTGLLVSPSLEVQPSDGINYVTYTLQKNIGLVFIALATLSIIASIWNTVKLLYFRYKNGLTD